MSIATDDETSRVKHVYIESQQYPIFQIEKTQNVKYPFEYLSNISQN